MEDAASQAGYNVFLCNTNWVPDKEETYLEVLEEKRVDGLILASVTDNGEAVRRFIQGVTPLVLVNRVLKDIDTHYVVMDNVKGGYQVVEYLLGLGHRTIGFIGGLAHVEATHERLQGYKMALVSEGIPVDESLIRLGTFKRESGYQNAMALIRETEKRPTAIFAASDILALGVIKAVQECGLKVPEDMAVVGFDDIPFAADAEVSLTTVAQPKYTMGEMAAKILLEEIKEGPPKKRNTWCSNPSW
ncbi:substrate-binding domain-containing protein [Desulforamulus profundi]|uniref:substrate-binding domain-containing protein n=1 Tax=Desulforamulus profundi TaxID=1383067 RepID=UPI001EE57854|nr:substrate-binding domain-containing protein [Desulforamulus profundi]